ncbi:hypothetical protein LBBP_03295 [Leptospira borgpetersenii serovar Ballum]|uniref:Uncharacterized protein n=1 Tax=Leptospira borgpetersenii serovar Ballum TaxID=280505 RepID=A0A0S2IV19_LEPBO|nr:hypothetical protein LBBP_03295 [Leptospira borgpetersenii serovar Ballum]
MKGYFFSRKFQSQESYPRKIIIRTLDGTEFVVFAIFSWGFPKLEDMFRIDFL